MIVVLPGSMCPVGQLITAQATFDLTYFPCLWQKSLQTEVMFASSDCGQSCWRSCFLFQAQYDLALPVCCRIWLLSSTRKKRRVVACRPSWQLQKYVLKLYNHNMLRKSARLSRLWCVRSEDPNTAWFCSDHLLPKCWLSKPTTYFLLCVHGLLDGLWSGIFCRACAAK